MLDFYQQIIYDLYSHGPTILAFWVLFTIQIALMIHCAKNK